MWKQSRAMLEMIRFSHTIFALPFALLSALLAWLTLLPSGELIPFRGWSLLGILMCMAFGRSAAMSFNRIVDRTIDAANPRTAKRHLVTGELTVRGVSLFFAFNVLGFVASTALFFPNPWPWRLAIPVLLFLCGYSLAKRFTSLAHFWLGAALMLTPICAWIAIRGEVLASQPSDVLPAMVLGVAVMLWVAGFDIIYACQDESFDRQAKLYSIPAQLGAKGALRLSAVCHLLMVITLALMPLLFPQLRLGGIYLFGIAIVALLLTWEHRLVSPHDLERVNVAFFHMNAVISLGVLFVVMADLYF